MMIVSVINMTNGIRSDTEVQAAIRAINRQLAEDFEPYWGFGGMLRLEGRAVKSRRLLSQSDMRGDAVLYLTDMINRDGMAGFHDRNHPGIPYGVIYLELSHKLEEAWTTTFSHEALELIADPQANLLVQGPHPLKPRRRVYHWFEMCDAVQSESYKIDGVRVSNFVLPLYFTPDAERGGRNDFLGTKRDGRTLKSFGANLGGYIGFFDPTIRKDDTFFAKKDPLARKRLRLKRRFRTGRGTLRRLRTLGR